MSDPLDDKLPLATEYRILLDLLLIAGEADRQYAREQIKKLKERQDEQLMTGQEFVDRFKAELMGDDGNIYDELTYGSALYVAQRAAGIPVNETKENT